MKCTFDLSLLHMRDSKVTVSRLGRSLYRYAQHISPQTAADLLAAQQNYSDVNAAMVTVKRLRQNMAARQECIVYCVVITIRQSRLSVRNHIVGLLTVDQQPHPLLAMNDSFAAGPQLSVWIAPQDARPVPGVRLLPDILDLLTEKLHPSKCSLTGCPWALVDHANRYVADVLTRTAAFGGFELRGELPVDGDGSTSRQLYVARHDMG